jgi:hypothetical protein
MPADHPAPGLFDDHVHGLLEGDETARVEAHCAECAECRARLEEARQLAAALQSVPPTEASPALLESTLRRIHGHDRQRRRRGLRAFLAVVGGAAAATLVLGLLQWHYEHLTPSTYDLVMLGQRDLLTATDAALRVRLFDRLTGRPIAGVPVTVELRRGKESVELAHFETDAQGRGGPRMHLPDWPPGDGTLRVVARTPGGDEVLTRTVHLRRSWKLMLSSDKPVYQPGQTIHVRSLALRRPDLHPVAGERAVFTLTDPRGNVLFKETPTTSRFGIAAADCALDGEIAEGAYTLGCKVGDTESRLRVEVKRYVLPKFRVDVRFDRPFYKPGEEARVTVRGDYFFGKPVAGGEVRVAVLGPDGTSVLGKLAGKTNDQGEVELKWTAPGGEASVTFDVAVTDKAGQEQTSQARRVVTAHPVRVEVLPEGGDIVLGVPNRVYLFVRSADGTPLRCHLSIPALGKDLPTDDRGLASFEYTPREPTGAWEVRVRDGAGHELALEQVTPTYFGLSLDFLLRTDRAVYVAGGTMHVTAMGAGREPVFVDILKDGQALLTQVVEMDRGRGELAFDLPPELSGTVQLCAYRFGREGLTLRKTRILYVRPASGVRVTATPDAKEYRPGGKATVRFALTDAEGRPAPGALSLAAVDEAVFSVLHDRPGMEETFYLLEQELLRPVYELYPWSPDAGEDRLAQALFAKTIRVENALWAEEPRGRGGSRPVVSPTGVHSLAADSFPEKVDRTAAQKTQGVRLLKVAWVVAGVCVLLAIYVLLWCFASGQTIFQVHLVGLLFLLAAGSIVWSIGHRPGEVFAPQITREAWNRAVLPADGNPLGSDWGGEPPDQGQGDPRLRQQIGLADAKAPQDLTNTDLGTDAPRVRERFPETLLWRPELVTDEQGRASLEIDLADAITTWRLAAGAVTADGRLGSAQAPLKVFQPFFADLNLPPVLTRGDELDIPAVVYNYLDRPQTITLALAESPGFRLLDGATRRLDLRSNEVRSVRFRLRAREVGSQRLELTARGGSFSDALRRTVEVVPDGRPVEQVAGGSLARPASVVLDLPPGVVGGSVRATLKVYPSGFSQLVEGLQNIFQMPSGCFEQTSSTTYPNVLALDYLHRTNQKAPAVEATARQYIHLGYQRLVGFEVPGGGFDWFGRPPANPTLTAYGLMEFEDMARVHDVDPILIERTRRWLLAQRESDGSWQHRQGIFHDDLTGGAGDERGLGTTAYIAWAVFARGQASAEARQTRAFLLRHRPEQISDPHVLALVCNALLAIDRESADAAPYLDRLESLKRTSADGRLAWWEQPQGAHTCFYGSGQGGQVETTALAVFALIEGRRGGGVSPALEWLMSQKDARGTWHSTQATVLALRALLAGTAAPWDAGEVRHVEVRMDGKVVREVVIPADHQDVLTRADLTVLAATGRRRLELIQTSGPASTFQVTLRYHVPGPARAVPNVGPLAVGLEYDRTELALGDVLRARVRVANNRKEAAPMVLLDLPVPPGFVPETDDFTALVQGGKLDRFQVRPRQVLVYLRGLAPGRPLELSYRLRPTLAGTVAVPGAHAYEYYAPEVEGRSPAVHLTVKPRD